MTDPLALAEAIFFKHKDRGGITGNPRPMLAEVLALGEADRRDAESWRALQAEKDAKALAAREAFQNRHCRHCLRWMDDTHFYASPECIGKSEPQMSPAEVEVERNRRAATSGEASLSCPASEAPAESSQ